MRKIKFRGIDAPNDETEMKSYLNLDFQRVGKEIFMLLIKMAHRLS